MSFTHEISFSSNLEEQFGLNARGFGLSVLNSHIKQHGIKTDRPLDDVFFKAALNTNSGFLLKAVLLPSDIFYLRDKGFNITQASAPNHAFNG